MNKIPNCSMVHHYLFSDLDLSMSDKKKDAYSCLSSSLLEKIEMLIHEPFAIVEGNMRTGSKMNDSYD